MRKLLILNIAILALAVLIGCSTTNSITKTASDVPEWYLTEVDTKDGIYGTGQAKMSDFDVSVKMAEADARNALAKKINVVISDVVQTMTSSSQSDAMKGFEENAFQTTRATIQGARKTNIYTAKDGTVYVQMYLPYETEVNTLNAVAKEYRISDEYLATQAKMQDSYDKYFGSTANQ